VHDYWRRRRGDRGQP